MMADMAWTIGQRVTFTNDKGEVYNGTVEKVSKGWVMIELDEPTEPRPNWTVHRMMLRESELAPL